MLNLIKFSNHFRQYLLTANYKENLLSFNILFTTKLYSMNLNNITLRLYLWKYLSTKTPTVFFFTFNNQSKLLKIWQFWLSRINACMKTKHETHEVFCDSLLNFRIKVINNDSPLKKAHTLVNYLPRIILPKLTFWREI